MKRINNKLLFILKAAISLKLNYLPANAYQTTLRNIKHQRAKGPVVKIDENTTRLKIHWRGGNFLEHISI